MPKEALITCGIMVDAAMELDYSADESSVAA